MCRLQNEIPDHFPEAAVQVPGDGLSEVVRLIWNIERGAHNSIIAQPHNREKATLHPAGIRRVTVERPSILRAVSGRNGSIGVAPQSGHVSNFCGLERGPFEPVQLLSEQRREIGTGTPIQTGRPAGTVLERRESNI